MWKMLAILAGIAGCGQSFVEFPVELGVDPSFTAEEHCLLAEAARRWEEAGPGLIEINLRPWDGEGAAVLRAPEGVDKASSSALGFCSADGIPIGPDARLAGGDIWLFTGRLERFSARESRDYATDFTIAAMHELGHHLGLPHTHGVMRGAPRGIAEAPCVNQSDLTWLCAIYGCSYVAPVCEPLTAC